MVAINSLHEVSHVRSDTRRTHPYVHPITPPPTHCTTSCDQDSLKLKLKINEAAFSKDQLEYLHKINRQFSEVFNNDLTGGYNHSSGRFFADFSFSSRPPPT